MTDLKDISGGRELDAFLQTLSAKVEKNIMRSALRQGANVVKAELLAKAPVKDGDLRKSIRVSTKAKGGGVSASAKVGDKKAFYVHMIEFGTKAHKIKGKKGTGVAFGGRHYMAVNHPGIKANPFIRTAFDDTSTAAIAAVAAQIRKRLTKEGLNTPAPETE